MLEADLRCVLMAKQLPSEKEWFEATSKRIIALCSRFEEQAEDYDVVPTDVQKQKAMRLMKEVKHSEAPRLSISVNSEIVLQWTNTGDHFRAFVQTDGSVTYCRNKTTVTHSAFIANVAQIPA